MADTLLFYRTADGVLLGSSTVEGSNAEKELASWGPGVSVLKVAQNPPTDGKIVKVINGEVVSIPDPDYEARIQAAADDRASGLARIKLACGMTDNEMNVVFGR